MRSWNSLKNVFEKEKNRGRRSFPVYIYRYHKMNEVLFLKLRSLYLVQEITSRYFILNNFLNILAISVLSLLPEYRFACFPMAYKGTGAPV